MILSFHPCITADHQIILGSRSPNRSDAVMAAQANAVLLPQTCSESLYRLCRETGTPCFPSYDLRFAWSGKSGQARLFRRHGLPHPETWIWPSVDALLQEIQTSNSLPHKAPFLLKTDNDHEGWGVRWIPDFKKLKSELDKLKQRKGREGEPLLTQALVSTGGNVLRAVILGHRVYTYWKRASGSNAFPTTVGRGAKIDASWRKNLQERGQALAMEIHRDLGINLAALDLVFDMTSPCPSPLLLEINYAFGRRGLGGSEAYYRLLFDAVCEWLEENGHDPARIGLV